VLGLEQSIGRRKLVKTVFSCKGEIYIVGGFIRDLIMGRRPTDIDIVVRGRSPRSLACEIRGKTGGKAISIGHERLERVILGGGATIDISRLPGSIEENLKHRDFTVNSMAWAPNCGLLDPLSGINDINKGVIRTSLKKNFLDDPLRVLRVYRFISQFNFTPEERTLRWSRELSGSLRHIASERITLEFLKTLEGRWWENAINSAHRDGVLRRIIPLKYNELAENFKHLSKYIDFFKELHMKKYFMSAFQTFSEQSEISLLGTLIGADIRHARLKLPSLTIKRLGHLNRHLETIKNIDKTMDSRFFEIMERARDDAIVLVIFGLRKEMLKQYEKLMRIINNDIISTEYIMIKYNISPGKRLGEIKREIRKRRFLGEIRTRAQAERLVSALAG
jgi:tRNA nucleotidyltransferase/poly(A) polymerase